MHDNDTIHDSVNDTVNDAVNEFVNDFDNDKCSAPYAASDFVKLSPFEKLAIFNYNWVPEVMVVDHEKEIDIPMSFHDIHLLGTTLVIQVIVTPRVSYLNGNGTYLGPSHTSLCYT